jgi:hypothetical protein
MASIIKNNDHSTNWLTVDIHMRRGGGQPEVEGCGKEGSKK